MKFIKYPLLTVLVVVLQLGCNTTISEKEDVELSDTSSRLASLDWVHSADVEQDVKASVAKQDYRLFALAGRGGSIPGVDSDIAGEVKQRCGIRYLQGSTDAVHDDKHIQLLQKAYNYAGTYNQLMLEYCR